MLYVSRVSFSFACCTMIMHIGVITCNKLYVCLSSFKRVPILFRSIDSGCGLCTSSSIIRFVFWSLLLRVGIVSLRRGVGCPLGGKFTFLLCLLWLVLHDKLEQIMLSSTDYSMEAVQYSAHLTHNQAVCHETTHYCCMLQLPLISILCSIPLT